MWLHHGSPCLHVVSVSSSYAKRSISTLLLSLSHWCWWCASNSILIFPDTHSFHSPSFRLSEHSSNMHFVASLVAVGSIASLASASGFEYPASVPLSKRQTSGPAYDCHANCGMYTPP